MFKKNIRAIISILLLTTSLCFAPVNQVEATEVVTNIERYDGSNREAVAVNVAQSHFKDTNKVIIVNRDKFPDAISATNISQGKYPVLYTREGRIDQETIDLLNTMSLDEIYILGGTTSVGETVVSKIHKETGVKVTRIDGRDRFVVNAKAVQLQYQNNEHVVIASGEIYTDALYGVSYANTIDAPVILAKKDRLTEDTVSLLKQLGVKHVTLIGGPGTLTAGVENQLVNMGIQFNRIAGANRYSGSAEVAIASYNNPNNVVIASGEVFSDALVSAPLAQKLDAPILLVRKNRLDEEIASYLNNHKSTIETIYLQGGPGTITVENEHAIAELVLKESKAFEPQPEITTVTELITSNLEPKIIYNESWSADTSFVHNEGSPRIVEQTIAITTLEGIETSRVMTGERVIEPGGAKTIEVGTKNGVEVIDIPHLGLSENEIYTQAHNIDNMDFVMDGNVFYMKQLSDLDKKAINQGQIIDEAILNKYFLELVNAERARVGEAPLMSDPTLATGTATRSFELATEGSIRPVHPVTGKEAGDEYGNILTHTRPYNFETDSFDMYYTAFYYRDKEPQTTVGENLAMFTFDGNPYTMNSERYLAEEFYEMWLNSPGHYANMIRPEYDGTWLSIAVGDASDSFTPNAHYYDVVVGTQILTSNAKEHNQ